ncbi:MAG: hypothetical protein M0Q93_02140 [Terrimicrobiaceae bacterium]|nr:hypothetical protein [Terrimicrobiaceae bacterium]
MDTQNNYNEDAKEFLEKFGFKEKLEESISNHFDKNIIYVLSANIAIFCVSLTIFFTASKKEILTAPIILIVISAILTLVSILLNIWYLTRINTRILFFHREQGRIFQKTENNIAKTLTLFKKILKIDLTTKVKSVVEEKNSSEDLINKLKKDDDTNCVSLLKDDGLFIFFMIMDLAIKDTIINIDKSFGQPLDESHPRLKLIIDNLSDMTKNWGLILGAAFILSAILIKFIVG